LDLIIIVVINGNANIIESPFSGMAAQRVLCSDFAGIAGVRNRFRIINRSGDYK
jgi:hypothetical protein